MKRSLFRILAIFFPTRKMRDYVRNLGIDNKMIMLEHFMEIISNSLDLKSIPKANGYNRDIQLAGLKILNIIKQFCKINDIKFFLIGGSIIGKIRHDGCIPWDDDIDIAIPDPYWHKFVKKLQEIKLSPDFYISFGTTWNILKICHKPTDIFIDIFRFSRLDNEITANNYDEYVKRKLLYKEEHSKLNLGFHHKDNINITYEDSRPIKIEKFNTILKVVNEEERLFKKIILLNKQTSKNGGFIHFSACSNLNEIFNSKIIEPIKYINFEGQSLPFPNKPEDYAFCVWGDIWTFPSKFSKHIQYIPDIKKYFEIKKLLEKKDNDLYIEIFSKEETL